MDSTIFSKFATAAGVLAAAKEVPWPKDVSAMAKKLIKAPAVQPLKQPGVRAPRLKFTTGSSASKSLMKSLLQPRKRKLV